jgi:hypothetical protein
LVKVRAFVNGVHIQKEYFSRQNQADQPPHIQRIIDQFIYWRYEIRDILNNMNSLELDQIQDLKDRFKGFLQLSREPDLTGKLMYHYVPMALRVLKRHVYFIVGGILLAVAMFSVDMVKNLILNEGLGVLPPLLGIMIAFGLTGILYFHYPLFGVGNDALLLISGTSLIRGPFE